MNQWPLGEMFCFAVFHYKLSCRFGHDYPKMLSFLVKVEKRKSRSLNIYLKFVAPPPPKSVTSIGSFVCLSQRCRSTAFDRYSDVARPFNRGISADDDVCQPFPRVKYIFFLFNVMKSFSFCVRSATADGPSNGRDTTEANKCSPAAC